MLALVFSFVRGGPALFHAGGSTIASARPRAQGPAGATAPPGGVDRLTPLE